MLAIAPNRFDAVEPSLVARGALAASAEEFGVAEDRRHRRTNFMAHVREELALRGCGGLSRILGLLHDRCEHALLGGPVLDLDADHLSRTQGEAGDREQSEAGDNDDQ
jgi:hypothetical protein